MTILGPYLLTVLLATMLLQCLVLATDGRKNLKSSGHRTHLSDHDIHLEQQESTQDEVAKTLHQNEMKRISHSDAIHSQQITASYIESDSGFLKSRRDSVESRHKETLQQIFYEKECSLSTRSDFPCPEAEDIYPCVCFYDSDYNISLNCTDVESEEQLASVFQQDFPVKTLHEFRMNENHAIKVLGNALNGVTFRNVILYPGPFAIEAVSEYFLVDSLDILEIFHIHNSNLTSDLFPFNTFNFAKRLDIYFIDLCKLTWIPPIRGPLITELSFDFATVKAVEPGTFEGVPNMQVLELRFNDIEELKAGTFPIHEVPTTLRLENNLIHTLEPGTFYMADANSSASNALIDIQLFTNQIQSLLAGTFFFRDGHMTVDLHSNLISSIEPGTFVMPSITVLFSVDLYLNDNQLTTFDEAVFVELLPYTTSLTLAGNPLECGCDIAWLVLNPDYMDKIDLDATCDNGDNLPDLDPDIFETIC